MKITSADEARVLARVPKGLLIDGVWRDSSDRSTLDVTDPATGQVIATIASATAADGTGTGCARCAPSCRTCRSRARWRGATWAYLAYLALILFARRRRHAAGQGAHGRCRTLDARRPVVPRLRTGARGAAAAHGGG